MRTTEVWIYAGVRVIRGKRAHAWIDPEGTELLYSKGRAHAIGYRYEVTVERADGHVTQYGRPRYAEEAADDETRQRLAANDSVARTQLAALALERKAGSQDALDEAMRPLIRLAKGMRTHADRNAFIAAVLHRLLTAW